MKLHRRKFLKTALAASAATALASTLKVTASERATAAPGRD
jgi:hypothetical protein